MANIIDLDFFYGALAVPQITETSVAAKLQRFIDQYEQEYLDKTLGYELAKDLKAGLGVGSPEQKWVDIRDGKEFTDRRSVLTKWKGLKFTEGTQKSSPIANYVFYRYARDMASTFTASGEAKGSAANAQPMDGMVRQTTAFNQMVRWNMMLREFLFVNQETYPQAFRNGFFMLASIEMFQPINDLGI